MPIERADLTALKVMFESNSELRGKLKSSMDIKTTVSLLAENALLNNISFDREAYETLLKKLSRPNHDLALADS